MRAPADERKGVWRGGVLQVKVTNACDLDCKHCSVGVGIARKLKRTFTMAPDDFRQALQSLQGYTGVIGMFGGNPCIHPQFEELCEIFRQEVPDQDQRGLWSNRLFGHGATCRRTFSGSHSNINVHQSQQAWEELVRDWPEVRLLGTGLSSPSMHAPIFGAMTDLGVPEDEMWDKVGKCYVNQEWSAEITMVDGKLRGYFCEVAATMAELTGDPSLGHPITKGWWRKPIAAFADQVRHYCTRCLVPFNGKKIDAAGNEPEMYTKTWAPVMATIKGRPMREVADVAAVGGGSPATRYLPRGTAPAL